ncbi:His-Xaa-Ser system radical SAM maturase HxsB [Bradyrhizobium barranii]|uniref:His-Xaa-Ser system radical SAM maturase HxsB n=1 Tax=Bradyrhizobium barranii TaxID=2992140 RepID=UPI0024B172AA|nr:His-Xaa-Ser system radical SAM maturase HxsB [Bradyrhizobium barranii]WFT97004.1 His-Xaa-Ser system radical SAM maturase HxsB [Bradyrhizobium barranii]
MNVVSQGIASLDQPYDLLPFRFAKLPETSDRVVVTSEAGEFTYIDAHDLENLVRCRPLADTVADDLEAIQVIRRGSSELPVRLLATKLRTRKSFLRGGPKLHIFVVTLRCDHSCRYCQVSRATENNGRFEMSRETAESAIDRLFDAPGMDLTVEFQGGEPLLAFDRIKQIVETIEQRNEVEGRRITFTITSTLHHLTDEILLFFKRHQFHISTSLDGPADLHDANRPLPARRSHDLTLAGIKRVREVLGDDRLSALTTLTAGSLEQPEAIIDEYVRLGFRSIFLRPLSPFGLAARAERRIGYSAAQFLVFYNKALDRILHLNREGIPIVEAYASLLLSSMLTPFATGYVDLRSPVGAGFGTMVYNYDGGVYGSDEGRMLAEMGNQALRLGSVHDPYADLINSDAMQLLAGSGLAESLPGCADCAFVHYCGPDPAGSLATSGDPVGHRAFSEHCKRHTGLFNALFGRLAEGDPKTRQIFQEWAFGKPAVEAA